MFNKIALCVASVSMMMASPGAMAHSGLHIVSPTLTFTLMGAASLDTLNCTLSLTGTLNENWVAHLGGYGARFWGGACGWFGVDEVRAAETLMRFSGLPWEICEGGFRCG